VTLRKSGRTLLDGVDLAAMSGEVLGIVGPNGAGKSSLLRAAAGLERLDAGLIRIDDVALAAMSPSQRARRLAYLPQTPEAAWPIPGREVVRLGRLPHLTPSLRGGAHDGTAVERAIDAVGASLLAERPVTSLSAGEKALILLARALAVEADILLADEPTAALDPHHQLAVMMLFRKMAESGKTVCVALHDLPLAARFCHRLAVMTAGRVERVDTPILALDDATLRRVYGVRAIRHTVDGEHLLVPWDRFPPTGES